MKYNTGDDIDCDFLILKASVEKTKRGSDYIKFDVRDADGDELRLCKKWDCGTPPEWPVTRIVGKVDEYRGEKYIKTLHWRAGKTDVSEFAARAPWGLVGVDLYKEFKNRFLMIENEPLRKWTEDFFEYWESHSFPELKEGEGANIKDAPGARSIHHAYRHGWMEHTLEVVRICNDVGNSFANEGHFCDKEVDFLIVGAYLHDVGKLFQICNKNGVYVYTDVCKSYGWKSNAEQVIGSSMLLLFCTHVEWPPGGMETFWALNNMILSHHGDEFSVGNSSYIISKLLHHADHISANINRMSANLSGKDEVDRDIVRESYIRITD